MDITAGLPEIITEALIKTRLIDLVSYASDAGFYYLLPIAVVRPVNEHEVIALSSFHNAFNGSAFLLILYLY